MESTSKIIEEIINRSPFLRESMTEGLINVSALARKIQPELESIVGREVNNGAIVMAIKRMSPGLYHKLNVKIQNVLGEIGDFIVKSNVTEFTFKNSDSLATKQAELIKILSSDSESLFSICWGVNETTVLINEAQSSIVDRVFLGETIISQRKNLSSVTIKLPQTKSEMLGMYYYILKQLAWEGINIIEVVSTSNEFTIIVEQNKVDKAFSILMNMKLGK